MQKIIQYVARCRNCNFETPLLDNREDAATARQLHLEFNNDHVVELGELEVQMFSQMSQDERSAFLRAD